MSKKHNWEDCRDAVDLLKKSEIERTLAKERIYKRLLQKIEAGEVQPQDLKKDGMTMMKRKWKTATAAAVALMLIGGALSTTSYAQGMIQSILARFQVGNMEIVQVDKERPAVESHESVDQEKAAESREVELPAQPKLSLEEARTTIGINFPAPTWMADFAYVNTVIHGKSMVEVQYSQGEKTVNFLISQGGENGIETTGQVKTEVLAGKKVYYANGIVIWEDEDFTVEMYAREDFDTATLETIIKSFAVGKPLTQQQIDHAKANLDSVIQTERARQAAPAAPARDERKQ
ncbi:hypothetical protein [Brevibacillus centrosporus]|uniref:DUF4367 domain-containing protein n=1 Tax=Brevibacillus centrosporus TaxID=54910 RepID=A0A1I4A3L2_9BACL|nr:hypothetical protein [Brevibacillus centrosporus]SFK50456.1 hypothetical protein SAMN05518846_114117 [Brevibacillus centrosporus]